jgi:hypothetical protein
MSQGAVTDYLFNLIAKQVDDRGLVVWYDPDRVYSSAIELLNIPNTTVARYSGSFFWLRHEIDHLLNGQRPPRLIVYVPENQGQTHHALVELEAAGVIMQPGQQPPNRNTRLAIIARHALRPILGEETAAEVEKQTESGKLSLADLNNLANKGKEISTGVLTLIFGSANPQDVALEFLASDRYDRDIIKKQAHAELTLLLRATFGSSGRNSDKWQVTSDKLTERDLQELRQKFARHVLVTDFLSFVASHSSMVTNHPLLVTHHSSLPQAAKDACAHLARNWRLRRDVRDSYVAAAHKVEQEFSLATVEFDPNTLRDLETFLACERVLLRHVEQQLLVAPDEDWMKLAESCLAKFWADTIPAIQARWALIAAAAAVLLQAEGVSKALKESPTSVPSPIEAYIDGETPWCLLDTYHRHMESRWYNFEPPSGEDHRSLDKLIVKAEQRYSAVGSQLAEYFIEQFSKTKHPINGLLRQQDIFETHVKPKLAEGKVAYVWVDALRFEMARELCRLLTSDFELSIQPALGTIPTITEIGMAALLPRANQSAKVIPVGGGKLGLEISGTVLKDRKDRIAFLKAHAGVSVFDAKLDDLLPKPQKKIKDGIQNAQLVLATSQEIDELCEADNIAQARLQMDGVLGHLRRGVRILSDLGIKTIVLAADHGHLFAEELSDDMKIDAPGGQTEDLHRRVWVGVGGKTEPSYLRVPLRSLGIESDLDIATPWTFACFKSKGGARAYFHGGLSPQELIIPVVVMTPKATAMSDPPTGIQWKLTPGSAKLTTRFFSVQVTGGQSQSSLFGFEPPKVRIELRANKKCVSVPVSASYGFEDATGEVTLKLAENDPKSDHTTLAPCSTG